MARTRRHSSLALLSLLLPLLLLHHRFPLSAADEPHFEGFDADAEDDDSDDSLHLPLREPPITQLGSAESQSHASPDPAPESTQPSAHVPSDSDSPPQPQPSTSAFEYWDEDEFEGLPLQQQQPRPENPNLAENVTASGSVSDPKTDDSVRRRGLRSYVIEILCGSFLIMFVINFFTGRKQNENIALAWVSKFATKGSIFEKNFSLLGVGDGKNEDSPLLLKEGQNVFKFYASGRRFCQGLLATLELQSRHDLISRLFNLVVPCKDEITIEVYMNDEAMDQVVFALAKKKAAKAMQKEVRDLQRFASLVLPPSNRKWVTDDLGVVSESKEVAGDLITEAVLDQVFGDKAFEKYGKGFISMHFSDQHMGTQKKMLIFKFALPGVNQMAEMTRLVALVPYYIDLIGRYKLSSQARSKTEAARQKAAQEAYKELQNARQEALQKKKAERRKVIEAEAKLSAEAIRRKEAKEKARQMKKAMPKVKMTRA
ncbi:uncharacterized protein At5g49945 [Diospyros lotus]|uniref:uncharacterized protein At5g49945 n=1 Tax=Diospyros lotus TaxID=55363 RepID=UPI002257124E|nr:uncharacterized protein At5g49945 [Diospyros lotus]